MSSSLIDHSNSNDTDQKALSLSLCSFFRYPVT
jgi:hypothetical protein